MKTVHGFLRKIQAHKLSSQNNQPLYVTTYVHNIELRHALIDPAPSLNIMPLSTLVGFPREGLLRSQSKCQSLEETRPSLSTISSLT